MGTDTIENLKTVPCLQPIKVHHMMCTELITITGWVSNILPDIEAARPGNPEGREALCTLNKGIDKAMLLLQYCRDCSKLYLALTGDKIIARCHRVRTMMEHSLRKIKSMVPLALALKISQIADDLRGATFILDSSEEVARKAIRQLLHQSPSTSEELESSEIRALKIAALRLHIASSKELLNEKRSIRKLLVDVGQDDPPKKKILTYLLHLLKKYGDLILQEIKDAPDDSPRRSVQIKPNFGFIGNVSEADILHRPIPPEEFKCPISLRLMYDPVVIASGLTYERVWIQKWIEEGNDTCPKSKIKLANLSMTSNVDMKNLISKWCIKFGVTIPDPNAEPESPGFWENSIASFGSSMNDIRLPIDFSSISLVGLDNCNYPDSLRFNGGNVMGLNSELANDDLQRFRSDSNAQETDLFPFSLSDLPWESKCKVIEDMKNAIDNNNETCSILSGTIMDQVARFLKDASDQHDSKAQKNGSELFLSLLRKSRYNKLDVPEKILTTLASLFHSESEVTFEVLAILELLSGHRKCGSNFIASGVLTSVAEFLDSKIKYLRECAVKILYNLSSKNDICSHIVSLGCIPKLVSMLNDEELSGKCLFILKNLSHTLEARIYFTETEGCIASFAQFLETGSRLDQEHAVIILLSLCSQRVEYCELVLEEGVIPPLWNISVNGSEKGKAAAFELLRLLKEVRYPDEQESHVSDLPFSNDTNKYTEEKKPSKKSRFLGMIFSKRNPQKK